MRVVMVLALILLLGAGAFAVWKYLEDRQEKKEVVERASKVAADRLLNGPTIDLTADELIRAYKNQVSADNDYKGQVLRVTGKLRRIRKSASGQTLIAIEGKQSFNDVVCAAIEEPRILKRLESLSAGDRITIRGFGAGTYVGDPALSSCFVEPLE